MSRLASLNGNQIAHLLLELGDPRGRCNARGLQRSTLYLLAIQVGYAAVLSSLAVSLDGTFGMLVNAAFCWIGFTLVSKRLHDIGRTGWWFAGSFAIWLVFTVLLCTGSMVAFGNDVLDEGTTARVVVIAATVLPLFAALIWLHFIPGDASENRFGPAPDETGYAMPAATDRLSPAGATLA